ncbi:hypothetical protein [Pectobacterium odoriferum]|uniref:hypothetical protein n=1 Tax=Pectobacterium odoriferum TaxID=78398 RepID=UPI00050441CF|nr:hypothetical protein [Pectobacterium odoriferum]KGA31106.1 hypothetical protein KS43_19355 [Pectobacterium odoriferum]
MNHLPKTTAKVSSQQDIQKEIESIKKALGLILAALPEDKRISVQQQLLESFDYADRDLATQINQFIFRDEEH